MIPAPDRIRADVARTLEANGIAPRRALRAAVRLVRGLALADRDNSDREPCETLYNMRDRIAELLADHGLPEAAAESAAGRIIGWLRKHWGGRTLTRQWWGFVNGGLRVSSIEIDGELFQAYSDPVKSLRGRELRAVVWGILAEAPPFVKGGLGGICRIATDIATLVECEWATIYVPLGEDMDRLARDKAVYKVWDGLGSMEKITALGVSQSRGYEIFKRLAADKEAREQPVLF